MKIFSKRGSVLVFSLIILSLMLVTALTILSSALLDRKASLSTGSSTRSFQVADSGAEEVLYQIYKKEDANASAGQYASLNQLASALGTGCSSGTLSKSFPDGSRYSATFFSDDSGTTVSCSDTNWRKSSVKARINGTSGSTTRAVELAIDPAPCRINWSDTGWENPPIRYHQTVVAYQAASGSPCVSEVRECSNGTLSGSYQYKNCSTPPPSPTTYSWKPYSCWGAVFSPVTSPKPTCNASNNGVVVTTASFSGICDAGTCSYCSYSTTMGQSYSWTVTEICSPD